MDKDESKGIIVNGTLSQSCSMDVEELWSMEEDKSEWNNTKQKDANNELTYDVPNYFNVFNKFECGRKILARLDMSYESACMPTTKEEYLGEMLEQLIKHNHFHGTPIYNENLK